MKISKSPEGAPHVSPGQSEAPPWVTRPPFITAPSAFSACPAGQKETGCHVRVRGNEVWEGRTFPWCLSSVGCHPILWCHLILKPNPVVIMGRGFMEDLCAIKSLKNAETHPLCKDPKVDKRNYLFCAGEGIQH